MKFRKRIGITKTMRSILKSLGKTKALLILKANVKVGILVLMMTKLRLREVKQLPLGSELRGGSAVGHTLVCLTKPVLFSFTLFTLSIPQKVSGYLGVSLGSAIRFMG